MDQTETTQRKKLSCGECSEAGCSTKETTVSCTDKSFEATDSCTDKPFVATRSKENGKDVFLSHSGEQKSFVSDLYTDLTNQRVSCFFDQDPESLPVAEDFPSRIFEATKTSKLAVLLLSKDFLNSKWPMQELAAFVEAKNSTGENPNLKILPLFYHIKPDALKEEEIDKEKWKQLKISEEKQTQWLEALKTIRRINGIKFMGGDDEKEFREKIVKEIWRILPPSQRYYIPPMKGGERMCQEVANFFNNVRPNENKILIAGLYGIAGHGKTSLGKAFCNFKLTDFKGKVCHLEFSRGDPFERVKLALQYLTHCPQSSLQALTDPDQAKAELHKRVRGAKVLLVLDNITEGDMDEVRYYIKADLGENSYILLSARSRDLLVNHFRVDSLSCMHVPILEDDDAVGILLENTSLEVCTLEAEDKAFALKCANRCSFSCDTDRRRRIFHPLALKAFGRHLSSKCGDSLSKWVAEIDQSDDAFEEVFDVLREVFDVLSEAFDGMPPVYCTIFMLLTIYKLPDMSPHKVIEWLAITCNEEISTVKKAVDGLCKKAFIEEFEPEMRIHDLLIEFAQTTANEMRKWLWWKGDSGTRLLISKDQDKGFELAKLEQCRYKDPSDIEDSNLKNLLLLQLEAVQNVSMLDFSPMRRLRNLTLQNCGDLQNCEGMENLVMLGWLRISKVNPLFELPNLSRLKGLRHLEIDIKVTQSLGDLTPCKHLREINVHCPSLLEFPRLSGLPGLKKVEFSACREVTGPLDCTKCVMLQSIVLNGCCKMAASPVLAGCKQVYKIVLSDCDAVTACPDIDEPSALKILELSISSKAASAPRSLESCDGLENLHLWNIEELMELPSFKRLSNLTVLKIGKCGIREPPDLTCCGMLEDIYFFTLKNLKRFPNFSSLSKLKKLSLYDCRRVQDPPDISSCHELQVFHLVSNDNMKGLPKMHECEELDEIKVSWHCDDEVTYVGIDPESCEVEENFRSCMEHFKDEMPVENFDLSVPKELRDWMGMQKERWMHGRTMLVKKYFRGVKLFCSVMASDASYESSNYYHKNYITLSLVDSKVIAFPTRDTVCKDRDWLNKVRQYFAEKDDIARASTVTECDNAEPISLPLPVYRVPSMQGEARMCQRVADLFNTVHPNEDGIRIAGLYGMRGVGKTALGKAFCNLSLEEYGGRVLHIEFCGDNALETQKLALQYLTHSRNSQFEWLTGEEDVRYFFCTKVEGQRVFLVLDNITEDSIDKVRDYLKAELGKESRILLIARSEDVLLKISSNIKSESCMCIPGLEEEEALAILLEGTSVKVSALEEEDRRLASECANSCVKERSFVKTFNPLALKAFGRHCFSKHRLDLSKWVAEIGRVWSDFDVIFAVLGMAFDGMDPKSRSIFMLLTQLKPPRLSSDEIIKGLAKICKEEVVDLHKNGFIEEIEPDIRINHLMEEFAEELERYQREDNKYRLQRHRPYKSEYGNHAMQGEERMCQKVSDFFNTVQPNEKGIRIAGLYGMPGQGKTTLARAFCKLKNHRFFQRVCHLEFCGGNRLPMQMTQNDSELESLSEDEVEPAEVSNDSELQSLSEDEVEPAEVSNDSELQSLSDSELESLSEDEVEPEEAQAEFYKRVKGKKVLLVLDNIETDESIGEVREYLRAELGEGSCILLIARSVDLLVKHFEIDSQSCMGVPILTEEEAIAIVLERASLGEPALSLFCQYAFPSDPHLDKELVQEECRDFPQPVQETVNRLIRRIDALDDHEKQCFSDLAAFPQTKSIRASALLDIWVYVRGMTRDKAVVLLLKFAAHHLLHLRRDTRSPSIRDDCLNSYILFQDDVQRKLALFLVELYNRIHFTRMYVSDVPSDFYPMRETERYKSSESQIVSFHTGRMTYMEEWPQMDFPEAEALILYIANEYKYCIPPFLFKMEKLKVLIIHSDNYNQVALTGLDNFQLPSHLRSLHIFQLSSLLEHCKVLGSLEKIRLSQCTGLDMHTMFDFPELLECYVESCWSAKELPAGICSSKSLEVLSITDCELLRQLPDELDKLGSLKELRLCKCFSLKPLPPSICNLTKLEILDISGGYVSRGSLYGEEAPHVESLAKLAKIPSFRCVICDKRIKRLFESSVRPGLLKFVVV